MEPKVLSLFRRQLAWLRKSTPHKWWRAWEIVRWRGPIRFFLLTARELLSPLMYWYVFYIVMNDLGQPSPEPYAKEKFDVKIYVGESLARIKADLASMGELTVPEIESRLKKGDVVAVAYDASVAVGYSWMTLSSGLELALGTTWIIHPDEAVLYGSFVLPQWRGRGIHSCLDVALRNYARQCGIVRQFGSMAVLNNQTVTLAKRQGKPKIMTVVLARVHGVNWTWRTAIGAPLSSRFTTAVADGRATSSALPVAISNRSDL